MPANAYMKLVRDGKQVQGSSKARGHEGMIEIFDWEVAFTANSEGKTILDESKQGESPSPSTPDEFSFSKYFDYSSDDLMNACWLNQKFSECIIEVYHPAPVKEEKGAIDLAKNYFLKIKLMEVTVSHYEITSTQEGELPEESLELSFDKIELEYRKLSEKDGSPLPKQKIQVSYLDW